MVNDEKKQFCTATLEDDFKEDSVLIGDVNLDGSISVSDATIIQKYLTGTYTLNDVQLYAADVNKDGIISVLDVTELQKLLV